VKRAATAALLMFAASAAAEAARPLTTQKDADSQQRHDRHDVASPNPTIDDAATTADPAPVNAGLTPVRPDVTAHAAPQKPVRLAPKRGRARTPKG
jgi:hypothetical protein